MIKAEADATAMTTEEKQAYYAKLDSCFKPQFELMPRSQESVTKAHYNMMLHKNGDEYFCLLCQKACWGGQHGAQDSHVHSSCHIQRINEQACADEQAGESKGPRRFATTPGFIGALHPDHTWSDFKSFWGDRIERMPMLLWDRMRRGSVQLRIDMPHWGKTSFQMIDASRVMEIQFGAATYPGAGKYDEHIDRVVPYGKSDQGTWDQLIGNDGYSKQQDGGEKHPGYMPQQGRGWWPVSVITWQGQHSDHGYHAAALYFRDVYSGRVKCYVVCWYQMMDGNHVLQVWATYFVSRL
jgi:hypothetical protein